MPRKTFNETNKEFLRHWLAYQFGNDQKRVESKVFGPLNSVFQRCFRRFCFAGHEGQTGCSLQGDVDSDFHTDADSDPTPKLK